MRDCETANRVLVAQPNRRRQSRLANKKWGTCLLLAGWLACGRGAFGQTLLPGFSNTATFDEQIRWTRRGDGVRVCVLAPPRWESHRRLLVVFATPNGNTIEQTLGCAPRKGRDFRFDIQHVAAQTRRFREIDPSQDVVLAVVQAPKLSWPGYCREQASADRTIRDLVASLAKELHADRVALTGHSGGGGFLFGYIASVEAIPATIERLVFLDANYSYSDEQHHGDKLLSWLQGDPARRLVVIAYDDREITLQGKKVVGLDGGTYRASRRMLDRFGRDVAVAEDERGAFRHFSGIEGQLHFFIHPNPEQRILHTALVGEMNGLLCGLTLGTDHAQDWGAFGGPRAYVKWIQPEPFAEVHAGRASIAADAPAQRLRLPDRPPDAPTGTEFQSRILSLPRDAREAAIVDAVSRGNIPSFLRQLIPVRVEATTSHGRPLEATYYVTPDYLAVGSDNDFFRIPMSLSSARTIAAKVDASLITTKMSDDIFAAAAIRLDPHPLTKGRDSVGTFFQHHAIIERQLAGKPRGQLVAGIKKDVVFTDRLKEHPNKVAIYGWHNPDGRPIQPLYLGHVDWYVDYSHGIRLVSNHLRVGDQPRRLPDILADSELYQLVSNEHHSP